MAVVQNEAHFDFLVTKENDKKVAVVKLHFGQTTYESEKIELAFGPVKFMIKMEGPAFTFTYAQGSNDYETIETTDAKFLSSETIGSFTGLYVGLYAAGNGKTSKAYSDFDWFEYKKQPIPEETQRRY